jgi:hypothetical protein
LPGWAGVTKYINGLATLRAKNRAQATW